MGVMFVFVGAIAFVGIMSILGYLLSRRQLRKQFDREAEKLAEAIDEHISAREFAEHANVAKSAFLANMSHELRTPLNGILGLTDVLSREKLTPGQARKIDLINGSSETLLRLLNDILDLSKIEAGAIEIENINIDLGILLQKTYEFWAPIARKKDVKLVFQKQKDLPERVVSDPTRLRQCLDNLISNAVKFTPENGRVSVRMTSKKSNGSFRISFAVEDTGVGINAANLDKLFKPFLQAETETARKFGGTGLGLAITKNLCQMMGGDVIARSELGEGTVFQMSVLAGAALIDEKIEGPVQVDGFDPVFTEHLKGLRCLVVEDNPVNLEVLRLLLEPFGLFFVETTNGKEALKQLETQYFDFILMDIQMPVLDGLETTSIIRKSIIYDNTIPIIAMTANAMNSDKRKSFEVGMDAFLTKPLKRHELVEAINSIMMPVASVEQSVA